MLWSVVYAIILISRSYKIAFTEFRSKSETTRYWTDLREVTGTAPGTWVWGDGSLLNHNPWRLGQPNSPYNDRAVFHKGSGLMNDLPAERLYHFICEK